MRVAQRLWTEREGWSPSSGAPLNGDSSLVVYFGAPEALDTGKPVQELAALYPNAKLIGCSTGGEIHGADVLDGSVSATVVGFEHTRVEAADVAVAEWTNAFDAGRALARKLSAPGLRALFVLSDGLKVNGSELVRGMTSVVDPRVLITGGLAGDGARFGTTTVGIGKAVRPGVIAAVGLYGDRLDVFHGSAGGWDAFGPRREITRAEGNVLYELDGEPALDLYKRYLGEEANNLPGSALLFPLRIHPPGKEHAALVRTILSIDEATKSMTFAGDVPQGHAAQLMKGNFDRLVDGASLAATQAAPGPAAEGASVAILVSCIGRKLLLGQRIGEEVETVADILGPDAAITGFYSYGEISPHSATGLCELHNQTMTITVFSEN
jgi:hypothetical protein